MSTSIFNGRRRGLGIEPEKEIYIKLGVSFREYLHHFKGAKLAVFLAIQLHADEQGECYPSYDLLQKETGYGRAAIAAALDELCAMVIEGRRVLTRRRERDERGLFTGSNRYLIYPSKDELKEWGPEFDYPTVDLSNCGKSELEEEPVQKEEPKRQRRNGGTEAPAPQTPQPAAVEPQPPLPHSAVSLNGTSENALWAALEKFNKSIRQNGGGRTISGTRQIAARLAARGETVESMREAWVACKSNAENPVGAFVFWTREEYTPPPKKGFETKTDAEGNALVWVDGQGWEKVDRRYA